MTDIGERLRARKGFWLNGGAWMMGTEPDRDCAEAAAEIERLDDLLWQEAGNRVEIERLNKQASEMAAIIRQQGFEIERLRADNAVEVELRREVQTDHKRLQVALNNLYPEIEQLRSLLFRAQNYIAGEHTLDRPKDAMLEQIDAALKGHHTK